MEQSPGNLTHLLDFYRNLACGLPVLQNLFWNGFLYFALDFQYRMIAFVVPHTLYPKGDHVDPKLPLPFINIASQKSHIVYHMGLFASPDLLRWFTDELNKRNLTVDMGKSCLRFKAKQEISYDLLAELATKMRPEQWIQVYEQTRK